MIGSIGATLYSSVSATSTRSRPWQVASAVALGVASGLLMTSSPLGAALLCLMFFFPVHLPIAIFAALLTAGFAWTIEPALGQLGLWCSGFEPVTHSIASLNSIPFVPWLRLNNTIVLGGVLLAVSQLIPTYVVIRKIYLTLVEEIAEKKDAHWIRVEPKHQKAAQAVETLSPRDAGDNRVYEDFETFEQNYALVDDGLELDRVMQNDAVYDQNKSSKYEQYEIPALRIKDALAKATLVDDIGEPPIVERQGNEQPVAVSTATSADDVLTESQEDPFSDDDMPTLREALMAGRAVAAEESQSNQCSDSSDESSEQEALQVASDSAIQRVEASLESRQEVSDLDTKDVAARAAELAGLVDEMLTAIKSEEVQSIAKQSAVVGEQKSVQRESVLRDSTSGNPESPGQDGLTEQDGVGNAMDSLDQSSKVLADLPHEPQGPHLGNVAKQSQATVAVSKDAASLVEEVAQHEEALRYLLHHLKDIKDRV